MPTQAENLQTALDNVTAALVEITASPKPDYSVGGRSFSWAAYFRLLTEQQKALREALLALEGPWEHNIIVSS